MLVRGLIKVFVKKSETEYIDGSIKILEEGYLSSG